jgi:hypothetical protein
MRRLAAASVEAAVRSGRCTTAVHALWPLHHGCPCASPAPLLFTSARCDAASAVRAQTPGPRRGLACGHDGCRSSRLLQARHFECSQTHHTHTPTFACARASAGSVSSMALGLRPKPRPRLRVSRSPVSWQLPAAQRITVTGLATEKTSKPMDGGVPVLHAAHATAVQPGGSAPRRVRWRRCTTSLPRRQGLEECGY